MKNLKLLLIAIISLLSVSCETIDAVDALITKRDTYKDPLISEYLEVYFDEADKREANGNPKEKSFSVTITIEDIYVGNTKVWAKCSSNKLETHFDLIFDQKLFDDIENAKDSVEKKFFIKRLEQIVVHEMGHGAMDYRHGHNGIMETGPHVFDNYINNKKTLLNEFFGTPNFK